jgi:serine O-acetyltransferase
MTTPAEQPGTAATAEMMNTEQRHGETSGEQLTRPDWTRETVDGWNPSRYLLRSIRQYQRLAGRKNLLARTRRAWIVVRHHFWEAVTGAQIPLDCSIGGGLLIPHPNGIVIHPEARIGANCLMFQQVTLGKGGRIPGAPVIGDHVDIGAGARILGGIRIGNGARIGANAVVLCDVPPGATAVGIPARIIPPREQSNVAD